MEEKELGKIPRCFGTFWCPDDCMVSCPYWQECEEALNEYEDEEEEWLEWEEDEGGE
jgi:hypothetical protein